jgi:uncharacterized protein YjbI with pentapeptide repeats
VANEEHVAILEQGVETWNEYRNKRRLIRPKLSNADLRGANLMGAALWRTDFSGANLSKSVGYNVKSEDSLLH